MILGTSVLAQMARGYGDHMDFDSGWSWAMMIGMVVGSVLLVGLIVWAIVSATRASSNAHSRGPIVGAASSGPTAREILDHRYARGEIDSAEYEERSSKLG